MLVRSQVELPEYCTKRLLDTSFIGHLIAIQPSDKVATICSHLLYQRENVYKEIIDQVVDRVRNLEYDEFYTALRVFNAIISTNDPPESRAQRVEYGMPA